MFSLLNAVAVIPEARVEVVQKALADSHIDVPVLLKAHQTKRGWLTLCGWVPGADDSICKHFPIEAIICPSEAPKLRALLKSFCAEIAAMQEIQAAPFLRA